MLMFGSSSNIIQNDNTEVFNINSMREGYKRLPSLFMPNAMGRLDSKDYDITYANYIMQNDHVFYEFFQIIYPLYIGKDVYLIYDISDWGEDMIESLLKLIQQRYGYNACRIDSIEDYEYYRYQNNSGNFSAGYGLYNLDQDKERFAYLVEFARLRGWGSVIKEGDWYNEGCTGNSF